MFSHSNNTNISGGEFHVTVTDALTLEELKIKNIQQGIELLQRKTAPGALHNSDERYDPPKCHPHTREAILQEIMDWIKDNGRQTRLLWLYGPAGAGKSAIEQTIAELCYQMNLLAASFFFSRSANGRNKKTFLITTIVYQLIVSIPEIREHVGFALYQNPSLPAQSLEAQMEALVVKPLEAAASSCGVEFTNSRPKVIVLDGLDECGDPESQRYILKVLMKSINNHCIPFSFIIASRPEQHIRETFDVTLLNSLTTRLVLDDKYQPDVDIRLLLQSKFQDIKSRHPSRAHLPYSWPSDEEVERLVRKSSGQFIYASTVIKFIDSHRYWPPKRLDIIFGISPRGKTTPFAEIDFLYFHILTSASDNIDNALEIFAVVLFLRHRDLKITPRFIESFLSLREGEVFTILSDLHSIIAVPSADERDLPLRFFHASLGDFLMDHSRSGDTFFLDSGVCHRNIANKIIEQLMNLASAPVPYGKESLQEVFPEQCLKATPDQQFLYFLYDFDMSLCPHGPSLAPTSHITQIFTETFDAINSVSLCRVPELFIWMQSQKHPDQKNNLFRHHKQSIKIWLYEELRSVQVHYHYDYKIFEHLLASATLVDFPQFRDIHHLIPEFLHSIPGNPSKRYFHETEDSDKWEIYVKYRKIVSRFLINHMRCNFEFFRWSGGQEHYVSLAKYLLGFLSESLCFPSMMEKHEVDIAKAVLIFLPIVFSQAKRSSAARDLLEAGSFSFNPQLPRRFPQENWDQLFLSSYKACKLAIAAEGDTPTIREPDAEIGTENRDQLRLLLSSYEVVAEGDKTTFPEPNAEIGTENWDHLLSSYEAYKLALAAEDGKQTIPKLDTKIGTSSRGSALHTIWRKLKGLFKLSKS